MRKLVSTTTVLIVLGVLAFGLAFIGWRQQGDPAGDAIFRAIHLLSLGGSDYDSRSNWAGNVWLSWARWVGLAFFMTTAFKAFGFLLSQQLADLRAQIGRINIAVIGDHPDLSSLCEAAVQHERTVLWLAPLGLERSDIPNITGVRIVDRPWDAELCRRYRVGRAQTIVIAFADQELLGLDTAVAVRGDYVNARIILLTANSTIADAMRRLRALASVQVVVAAALVARMLIESGPPFLLAREAGQQRLHCLMLGCGAMGEALIGSILLSSLTTFLGKPRFTIVDPRAGEIAASMAVRQPELHRSADFDFVEMPFSTDVRALPVRDLIDAQGDCPYTVAYVCLGDDLVSLNAAIAIDRFAQGEGWSMPCFVRQRIGGTAAIAGRTLASDRIVPFGSVEDLAGALGLYGDDPDRQARAFHEAYRGTAPDDAVANRPWEDLPEELREANRNALVHIPAKLASAGVDLRDWLERRRSGDASATCPALPDLTETPVLLEALSMLEHERWMVDRRLNGWRYGAQRDDMRRLHPDLVAYEDLSPTSKGLDKAMIVHLADQLGAIDAR